MNFIARETRKLAIKTQSRITDQSPRHNVHHNSHVSANINEYRANNNHEDTKALGRNFAGQGLANSLGINDGEAIRREMNRNSNQMSELDRMHRDGARSISDFSDMFRGSQLFKSEEEKDKERGNRGMSVFLTARSIVNGAPSTQDSNGDKKEETPTVDNLTGVVKRIYLKIREQLDDPSHPLIRVIKDF